KADPRRLRRSEHRRPVRVRLRHGCQGLLAQLARNPRHAGVLRPVLAIIGGSGLSKLGNMEVTRRKVARTPYGEPSGALTFGRIGACDVVFLARHGYGHTIAPHEVNYRANLWALKDAGAGEVVSIASVGAISSTLAPGALVLPHQVIDYTWGRHATYFEGKGTPVNHIDFTEPYSRGLRAKLVAAAKACGPCRSTRSARCWRKRCAACAGSSSSSANDPRSSAHGRSAPPATLAGDPNLRHAGAPGLVDRHARHHGASQRRRARRAADRRRLARRDLRRACQPALSGRRGSARHRPHQPGAHAARRGDGGGLGGLPLGSRDARRGAA